MHLVLPVYYTPFASAVVIMKGKKKTQDFLCESLVLKPQEGPK